jgi:hypothetical protein
MIEVAYVRVPFRGPLTTSTIPATATTNTCSESRYIHRSHASTSPRPVGNPEIFCESLYDTQQFKFLRERTWLWRRNSEWRIKYQTTATTVGMPNLPTRIALLKRH